MNSANAYVDNQSLTESEYNRQQWLNLKKKEKEFAYKMVEKGINHIGNNMKGLTNYLTTQAKFELYSVNNCLLIMGQMPNATEFKEVNGWQKDGYIVKKRDKGFIILEPSEPYIADDGTKKVHYNPKKVYDITATNAPINNKKEEYTDENLLVSLIKSCSVFITPVNAIENTNKCARYDKDENRIYVCRGKVVTDVIQDLVGEMAKVEFVSTEPENPNINFKALCVSYMYCSKYGVEFPKEQFMKLDNEFSNMNKEELKKELNSIRETFAELNSRMLQYIQKENKKKEQVR